MEKEGFDPEATRETSTHLQRLYDEQNVRVWNIQQKLWVILGSFTIAIITLIATQSTKIPECPRYLHLLYNASAITVLISTFWLFYLLIPRETHAAPRLEKLYNFTKNRIRFNDETTISRQVVKDLALGIKKKSGINGQLAKSSKKAILVGLIGFAAISLVLLLSTSLNLVFCPSYPSSLLHHIPGNQYHHYPHHFRRP